jgi:hypothetical protein
MRAFLAEQTAGEPEMTRFIAQTPLLSLADLATGHDMHLEAPHEVARLILGHLSSGRRPSSYS